MKSGSFKLILFLSSLFMFNCFAQQAPEVIQLWEGAIPNAIENSEFEEIQILKDSVVSRLEQVSQPTLTVFKPETPNGTAVVIFPGGGYHHLSIYKEGYKVAEWLNKLGITAFVLKYRLPNDAIMKDKSIGPLQDAQKAIRYVRANAELWQIQPNKIGVIGFSAGGHLAATLSTQYDKNVYDDEYDLSAKPDFAMLIYPVISMKDTITHRGSKINLLGESPSYEKIENFSNELQVDAATPATFLVHATDEKSVPVQNSLDYYSALKAHKIPVEMHIYQSGGHGFGLGRIATLHSWTIACTNWLKANLWMD